MEQLSRTTDDTLDERDEEILTSIVSDEALEDAGGGGRFTPQRTHVLSCYNTSTWSCGC